MKFSNRTFYLCLGSQKAGTSWVFTELLSAKPRFCIPYYKEMNVLHVAFNPDNYSPQFKRHLLDKCPATEKMRHNLKKYYSYYDRLCYKDNTSSADFSPSYSSTLSVSDLKKVKKSFQKRGFTVKVVYLMREPIGRMNSSIKMHLNLNHPNRITTSTEVNAINTLIEECSTPEGLEDRWRVLRQGLSFDRPFSNYSEAVKAIDRVFPQKDVFYGFYETLFTKKEQDRLHRFFEIPKENRMNITRNPNPAPIIEGIEFKYSHKFLVEMLDHFKKQYEFVEDRFDFPLEFWYASLEKITKEK